MTNKGYIHVYTGDGKGKTTAAVGLALRAFGSGMAVMYASFHKNPNLYGYYEIELMKKYGIKTFVFAKDHPHLNKNLDENIIKLSIKEAFKEITDVLNNNKIDVLILDEILISVRDNYLDEDFLINFIKNKPLYLELILTGRSATVNIMNIADYVSIVKKIKHPFDNGVTSRKGIEY